jgi:hypothetical protein
MSMFICTVCRRQFSSDTWQIRYMERSHPYEHQKIVHSALDFSSNQLPHNQPTNPKKFKPNSESHSASSIDHHEDQQLFDQIDPKLLDPLSSQVVFPTSIQVSDSIVEISSFNTLSLDTSVFHF